MSKSFPKGPRALDSISLKIAPGERLVVLGPSGSGKSTLLRIIAGLESPSTGRVVIDGEDQADAPPHRRNAAMVFQNPTLFPHLSVFDNLAFGVRARETREVASVRVLETASLLGLSDLLRRRPAELSGGERQRTALGRAIAARPRVLLLDEPFSSLDAPLRAALRDQVLSLHERFGMTMIHVTHDQAEALAVGDRIAVLNHGRLMQCDSPRRIYESPAHRFIGEFVGNPPMNVVPCEIIRESNRLSCCLGDDGSAILELDGEPGGGPCPLPVVGDRIRLDLGFRPEQLRVLRGEPATGRCNDRPVVSARVERVEYQGCEVWIHLRLAGRVVKSRDDGRRSPSVGEVVHVAIDIIGASWFDPDTGSAARVTSRPDNPFAAERRP